MHVPVGVPPPLVLLLRRQLGEGGQLHPPHHPTALVGLLRFPAYNYLKIIEISLAKYHPAALAPEPKVQGREEQCCDRRDE